MSSRLFYLLLLLMAIFVGPTLALKCYHLDTNSKPVADDCAGNCSILLDDKGGLAPRCITKPGQGINCQDCSSDYYAMVMKKGKTCCCRTDLCNFTPTTTLPTTTTTTTSTTSTTTATTPVTESTRGISSGLGTVALLFVLTM